MPYSLIVIIAVTALTLYYVFASEASRLSKALVGGVLSFCLVCRFGLHRFPLLTLFLMVGLGIFISIYRICVLARYSDGQE
jgi:hypothetical protein